LVKKPANIFYGWWIIGAAFITGFFIAGSLFQSFTAFFEPIADEFGWSYAEVSLGFSIRSVVLGLFAPIIGILVDRLGPRRLIFVGAVITASGIFVFSKVNSLGTFYAAFILMAVGLSCCTITVLMTAIANWFHAKIGLAVGIVTCGFGLGGLLIPVIVKLIDTYGWRGTLTIMTIATLLIILPLSLLFRHKPEQYGYQPDNGTVQSAGEEKISLTHVSSTQKPSMKTILRSRPFWHLAVTFTLFHLIMTSIVAHVMPYLSSIEMSRSSASIIATMLPLMSIIGSFTFGRLGDKRNRKKVAAFTYAMACVGLIFFAFASFISIYALAPFMLLYGIGHGGCNAMRPSLTSEVFGRESFGTVFGLIVGINALVGSAGPIIAGWAFDHWGSYQNVWFFFAGLVLISLLSIVTTPDYRSGSLARISANG
jgi:MFS family permease